MDNELRSRPVIAKCRTLRHRENIHEPGQGLAHERGGTLGETRGCRRGLRGRRRGTSGGGTGERTGLTTETRGRTIHSTGGGTGGGGDEPTTTPPKRHPTKGTISKAEDDKAKGGAPSDTESGEVATRRSVPCRRVKESNVYQIRSGFCSGAVHFCSVGCRLTRGRSGGTVFRG